MRAHASLSTRFTLRTAALLTVALLLSTLSPQTTHAAGTADLAVTMTSSSRHLRYQESMTVTIVVTNLGPDTATGVTLSTGESDSINPGQIVCADGTVAEVWERCAAVTLVPGESATYTWTVTACCSCCPDRVGVTTAIVRDEGGTSDPNPDNNVARIDTRYIGRFPG